MKVLVRAADPLRLLCRDFVLRLYIAGMIVYGIYLAVVGRMQTFAAFEAAAIKAGIGAILLYLLLTGLCYRTSRVVFDPTSQTIHVKSAGALRAKSVNAAMPYGFNVLPHRYSRSQKPYLSDGHTIVITHITGGFFEICSCYQAIRAQQIVSRLTGCMELMNVGHEYGFSSDGPGADPYATRPKFKGAS